MRIHIKDLSLRAIIGAFEWERTTKHNLVVNIWLDLPDEISTHSDVLADTVNYHDVVKQVMDFAENSSFQLIEKLAREVLDIVLSYEKVTWAKVEIDKPDALRYARSVSVTLEAGK